MAKILPASAGPWVGQEDPLKEEMAAHSSILAWKNSIDGAAWWAMVHRAAKSGT